MTPADVAADLAMLGERSGATPSQRLRALRRLVFALEECLGALPSDERKVLRLRAGLGSDRPRSLRRVAQLTELPLADVRRLERSGLRRLGRLAGDGCTAGAAASRSSLAAGLLGDGSRAAGIAVLGERALGESARAFRDGEQPTGSAHEGGTAVPDLSLLLVPLIVLAFVMYAAREVRRTLNGW